MTEQNSNTPVNMSTGELVSTTGELSTGTAAAAFAEIQGTITIAKQFPRNVDKALEAITSACSRMRLAEIAQYSFPRGGKQISGKSVYLARELARCFGNIRYGLEIVYESDDRMQIRGWCWDVENNVKVSADDKFQKLIQRKDKQTGKTIWKTPDERDLRELVFRRGAILVRNCILQVVPSDLSDDAVMICNETIKGKIKDMAAEKKNIIVKFKKMNVTVDMLERYIDVKSADWTKDTLVELIGVYNAIKDNQSSVSSYFSDIQQKPDGDVTDDKIGNGKAKAKKADAAMNGATAGKSADHKEVYDKDEQPEGGLQSPPDKDVMLFPMSDETREELTAKLSNRILPKTSQGKKVKIHIDGVLKSDKSTEGDAKFCFTTLDRFPVKEDE